MNHTDIKKKRCYYCSPTVFEITPIRTFESEKKVVEQISDKKRAVTCAKTNNIFSGGQWCIHTTRL
jgi:hypothetical protein